MSFKIREDHLIAFANFFEEYPDFARGRLSCSNARQKFKKLWQELANILNSLGYGTRTTEKWQRTWSDYKLNIKKRASELKKQQTQTGGGPLLTNKGISDTDNRLLNILGKTFFEGYGTQEKGFESYHEKLVIPKKKTCSATSTITSGTLSVSPVQQIVSQIDLENMPDSNLLVSLPSTQRNESLQQEKRKGPDDDHDYFAHIKLQERNPNKKKKHDTINYYQDTINILENIDNRLQKLENRLENIDNTLNTKLTELCEILRNKNPKKM